MPNLLGIHEPDQQAADLFGNAPGTVVFAEAIGSNPNDKAGGDYRWWADRGYRVVVRLNNGWRPDGTIPAPALYEAFAQRCANFVAAAHGCDEWIIGNEPTHENERPNGQAIKATDYARCFALCRNAIKRVQPLASVIVAGPAPWNQLDWLQYWNAMLVAIANSGGADGIALHAYTHGTDPNLVDSDHRNEHGWLWHFRTFEDQLNAVPTALRHLPTDITEADQDEAWLDANSGWVQRAARRVNEWNNRPGTQKIRSVVLYRWPRYDEKYSFADKSGVKDDFRAAMALGFQSPVLGVTAPTQPQGQENKFMPFILNGTSAPPTVQRKVDQRLFNEMGVSVIDALHTDPNAYVWRLIEARWFNEQEAGGRHHIYVEAVDENGNPVADVPFEVRHGGKAVLRKTNGRSGFDAANFDMYSARNGYDLHFPGGDAVNGVGMGAPTPDGGFNAGAHTAMWFKYQRQKAGGSVQPQPQSPATVPTLVHPVADPRWRTVTQPFGVNGDYYKRFKVDGVPLKGHNGIDFGTPVGVPIVAVDGGRVAEVAYDPTGYGQYVKLEHPWGETLYAHLSQQPVTVGATVARGQQLGLSGNSGNSSGPHLHFGMRVKPFNRADGWGGYIDPASYLINVANPQPIDGGPFLPGQPQPPTESKQAAARQSYLAMFRQFGAEFGVDWHLLAAMAYYENKYQTEPVSNKGALGMMQFMPSTWADMQAQIGVTDALDPAQSIKAAAYYLSQLRTYLARHGRFGVQSMIAGYNWGPGMVRDHGWEKAPPETVRFVDLVVETSECLRRWEDGWQWAW